jgi:hypothetical protein
MSERLHIARTAHGSWVPTSPALANLVEVFDDVDRATAEGMIFAAAEEFYPGHFRVHVTLDEAKAEAFERIDARTDELFASGFEFNGHRYSLTNEAQSRFLTMLITKDLIGYPIVYNSIDDTYQLEIGSAAETQAFVFTALGTGRAYLDSGTALKDAVRQAATVEDVSAVVDPR